MKISLLNGPNINLLGTREPGIYGHFTLQDVQERLQENIDQSGRDIELDCFQSNHEGELIDYLHKAAREKVDYVIFNPAAYTHTSLALGDAIAGTGLKVIEVHISNIHKREQIRHRSFVAPVAVGQISGFGINSYILALHYILEMEKI